LDSVSPSAVIGYVTVQNYQIIRLNDLWHLDNKITSELFICLSLIDY